MSEANVHLPLFLENIVINPDFEQQNVDVDIHMKVDL